MQVHGIIDGESFHISLKKMFVSIVLGKEASWPKLKEEKNSSHQIQSLFIDALLYDVHNFEHKIL